MAEQDREHRDIRGARQLRQPDVFVGDEMFFVKDRLREVEEEIVLLTHPSR